MIPIRSGAVWLLLATTGIGPLVRAEENAVPNRPSGLVPAPMQQAAPVPVVAPAVRRLAAPVVLAERNDVRWAEPGSLVPRRIIVDANGVRRSVPAEFNQWAFGAYGDNGIDIRRHNLTTLLQQRIEAIDTICILTPDQRSRLELAGRGDIARLFDALGQVKREVEAAKEDFHRVEELYRTYAGLRQSAISGPFGEDSLLSKSIEPQLDPTQAARFGSLRDLLANPLKLLRDEDGFVDVQFCGGSFDDKSLSQLGQLGTPERPLRLRTLFLYETQVSDAGLASFPASETLEKLSVLQSPIGDAGLVNLGRFPNLRRLNLIGLEITDESLKRVGKLTQLTALSVSGAQVSNEGLSHLRGLTELTTLGLQAIPIGDEDLAQLEKMKRLQLLSIRQTNVTDAGIVKLRGLRQLRMLCVQDSKVTAKGIAELKKTFPDLSTDIQ